ncbi:hypothetical protein HF086_003438 [Spodoptera exigua]|uniref:Uncharacterized protein n=1 Tax=Spodoptera exigua TaxID=7107 RepID=A0A922SGA5_SPOEX|nr:hypothetical protein HF086_003438 [Spodoptera exigua]
MKIKLVKLNERAGAKNKINRVNHTSSMYRNIVLAASWTPSNTQTNKIEVLPTTDAKTSKKTTEQDQKPTCTATKSNKTPETIEKGQKETNEKRSNSSKHIKKAGNNDKQINKTKQQNERPRNTEITKTGYILGQHDDWADYA